MIGVYGPDSALREATLKGDPKPLLKRCCMPSMATETWKSSPYAVHGRRMKASNIVYLQMLPLSTRSKPKTRRTQPKNESEQSTYLQILLPSAQVCYSSSGQHIRAVEPKRHPLRQCKAGHRRSREPLSVHDHELQRRKSTDVSAMIYLSLSTFKGMLDISRTMTQIRTKQRRPRKALDSICLDPSLLSPLLFAFDLILQNLLQKPYFSCSSLVLRGRHVTADPKKCTADQPTQKPHLRLFAVTDVSCISNAVSFYF
jgi:hypothetical protein